MGHFNRVFIVVLDSLGIGATLVDNFGISLPGGCIGHSILQELK